MLPSPPACAGPLLGPHVYAGYVRPQPHVGSPGLATAQRPALGGTAVGGGAAAGVCARARACVPACFVHVCVCACVCVWGGVQFPEVWVGWTGVSETRGLVCGAAFEAVWQG